MQSANKSSEPDPFTPEEFLAWQAVVQLRMGELERNGLVKRTRDPEDGRSFLATLTRHGLRKLREPQVTHHVVVRERFLERLSGPQIKALAGNWDRAVPGVVGSDVWRPLESRGAA